MSNFKTINGVSCRIDDDGNLDLENGEVIKFASGYMDHYDIDGGLIQSRSAGDPVYEEWKARYDELMAYVDDFDAEEQVQAEEDIASIIFSAMEKMDDDEETGVKMGMITEEACGDLGRQILKHVLWKFRPDMFVGGSREEMEKLLKPVTKRPKNKG
jgi:hypothetical protein